MMKKKKDKILFKLSENYFNLVNHSQKFLGIPKTNSYGYESIVTKKGVFIENTYKASNSINILFKNLISVKFRKGTGIHVNIGIFIDMLFMWGVFIKYREKSEIREIEISSYNKKEIGEIYNIILSERKKLKEK